jgi:hypothetical protein
VVVAGGTYRERVCPLRGGTGPDQMISYEAAPGQEVVIKGSRLLESTWVPSSQNAAPGSPKLWMAKMPEGLFVEENLFQEVNLADEQIDKCMPWAVSTKGKVPNTLRRGLLFQNGERLRQVASPDALAERAGSYWVEKDGLTLHLRPPDDSNPNQARLEVTTQGLVFAPETFGLGYIRVQGLTIEHSGNRFPRPQQGALSTMRGHHWIIQQNTVRQCNSIGIDVGDQFDTAGPELAQGGQHVVRGNTVTDCGIGGIEGKSIQRTLIENNVIRRCGWQDIWPIYEVGGIKVHCTVSTLIRRNIVTDTVSAPGIWMDYANVNSRCTRNVIINIQCANGGIFMEASQVPNMVDTNFVWNTAGNGIYQHDCDELLIAHNLVGRSTQAAIRMQICQGRRVGGRLSTAKRNRIFNNILVDNAALLAISDPDNTCDYNVFAAGQKPFDLAQWQKAHAWDRHSTTADLQAAFDPKTLELTWSAAGEVPECHRVDGVDHDFWGRPSKGETVSPGPFGAVPLKPTRIAIDPRTAAGRGK